MSSEDAVAMPTQTTTSFWMLTTEVEQLLENSGMKRCKPARLYHECICISICAYLHLQYITWYHKCCEYVCICVCPVHLQHVLVCMCVSSTPTTCTGMYVCVQYTYNMYWYVCVCPVHLQHVLLCVCVQLHLQLVLVSTGCLLERRIGKGFSV